MIACLNPGCSASRSAAPSSSSESARGTDSILALERLRVEPSRGAAGIRDQIQAAFATLLAKANLGQRQIEAVGIGFGGPVDVSERTHPKVFPGRRLG